LPLSSKEEAILDLGKNGEKVWQEELINNTEKKIMLY